MLWQGRTHGPVGLIHLAVIYPTAASGLPGRRT
jgi:hypothetical protein